MGTYRRSYARIFSYCRLLFAFSPPAEYKQHWTFGKPEKAELLTAGNGWAINEIDRFTAAKLASEKVEPSPEAGRPYLIRRVFFDLTGLPPEPAEIDRWENETAEDWYEQLVDDLLARPAYGERMAMYWMDPLHLILRRLRQGCRNASLLKW